MMRHTFGRTLYALALVALAVALVASAVRAQSASFYARRTEIQRQAKADQAQAQLGGDANRKKLYQLYPTPEIPLARPVMMAAGTSAPLSIAGKFSDKTTFVSATDGVELTNPLVTANSFKATVTVAAGIPPSWGRIYAFAPVSAAEGWVPAVFIGAPATYALTAANGWTIRLAPDAAAFRIEKPGTATATYKAQYFKAGAAAPFETTTGTLTIEAESSAGSYTFFMSPGNSGSAAAEVQRLTEQMMTLIKDGKVSSPQFEAIQKKVEAAQEQMIKEMEAGIKDPAALQKKHDDFGCETINLFVKGGAVTGNVSCGKNVGSSLNFTGR